jgi:hypothetical protein
VDKDGRGVELTTLPPSCAECLEIGEPRTLGTVRACPGIALPLDFDIWRLEFRHVDGECFRHLHYLSFGIAFSKNAYQNLKVEFCIKSPPKQTGDVYCTDNTICNTEHYTTKLFCVDFIITRLSRPRNGETQTNIFRNVCICCHSEHKS